MISRAERGPLADWFRSIDRWLLGSFAALMVIGLVMALAASPAVAERLNLPTFHFVNRQALLLAPTALLMVATSFLSPRHVRRANGQLCLCFFGFPEPSAGIVKQLHIAVDRFPPTRLFLING